MQAKAHLEYTSVKEDGEGQTAVPFVSSIGLKVEKKQENHQQSSIENGREAEVNRGVYLSSPAVGFEVKMAGSC